MIPLSPHHISLLLKCDQINVVLGFWRPQAHVHQRRLSIETSTSSEVAHTRISYPLLTNDFLSEELSAEDATHKSFMEKRHRHSSVPQTVKPTGPVQGGGLSCLFVQRSVYVFVLFLHITYVSCLFVQICLLFV